MTTRQSFAVNQPTRFRFGNGSISQLAEVVRECGGSKALVVLDSGLQAAGLAEKITAPLKDQGIPFLVFDQISQEPILALADKGLELARDFGADCVIGAGGRVRHGCWQSRGYPVDQWR